MKILVVGIGYVGLANAILLSRQYDVLLADIDENKVKCVNNNKSPINDELIEKFFRENPDKLKAILADTSQVYKDFDYIIIAVSTNYNDTIDFFDTKNIEDILKKIKNINSNAIVIIKSTIPIGYTKRIKKEFKFDNIVFSPEFLREGSALYDCLNPSRMIIGDKGNLGKQVAELFYKSIQKNNLKTFFMDSDEAESVKLFSNTYLAMRISFFNEIDTYAKNYNLNVLDIINGVCADPRIGDYYNNPSFGYGGYCLPKDTKQLLANFKNIPNSLIKAIVESNEVRKKFISNSILSRNVKNIGIFRLIMKNNSDNFRNSVILDIINYLKKYNNDLNFIIHEPLLKDDKFQGIKIENNLNSFIEKSDLIVANRISRELIKVKSKIFSSDLFLTDL
ncbi:nucleotide sugar dehydrogenase [Campylobacter novaezeelandiae]|uniref:nucleotide sugar dehydrogenase n=2 Tax=Campylobacter novaezeelandiae TaxID=2267891 RepID=UPI001907625B|nr:nucleotide sugar dehydrogenase [Campylobacter novaezeelandiae]MBK1963780.1 nucleotide sugar dehydrogenase [Campylobacter novaezeelandiae]